MPSLRDRLRAAMPPVEKKPECRPKQAECMVRRASFPRCECCLVQENIAAEELYLVFGEEYSEDIRTDEILFLDTETTGLSGGAGTLAFEIGIGWFSNECFETEQFVMRDYDEELPMLQLLSERLAGKKAICTFNGKTFDVPLLTSRFVMNRMRFPELKQMDLLHAARRVWKLRLGRCNLSSLEEAVLGRKRQDDLPGSLVPQRFFDYLKTGDASLFEDVLRHNLDDVKSLTEILSTLLNAHSKPESLQKEEDIYSVGRVLDKRGYSGRARVCYRLADRGGMSVQSRSSLAENLRRAKCYDQAAELYKRMISSGQGGLKPYIALAKLYEHRLKNPKEALKITYRALSIAAERNAPELQELQKRYKRLIVKTGGTTYGTEG